MELQVLGAVVVIFEADYVFFGEGVACLHFDKLERAIARAGDAMSGTAFYKNVAPVFNTNCFIIERDLADACNNHPMFIAVFVALQTQSLPRIHH